MYVYGLRNLAKIVDILKLNDLRDYYLAEAKAIGDLGKAHCWDEERGLFKEGPQFDLEYTQHAQMWAVLTGIVTGNEAAALMEKALTEPGIIKCTFPLKYYLFRALEAAGLYEKTDAQWEDWKRLLPLNLSTIPETPYDNSRSDCHAWSSLLLFEYHSQYRAPCLTEAGAVFSCRTVQRKSCGEDLSALERYFNGPALQTFQVQ